MACMQGWGLGSGAHGSPGQQRKEGVRFAEFLAACLVGRAGQSSLVLSFGDAK